MCARDGGHGSSVKCVLPVDMCRSDTLGLGTSVVGNGFSPRPARPVRF